MEAIAKLRNHRGSPRKTRLVADILRGKEVEHALQILKHQPQKSATYLEKLLLSAVKNWEVKHEGATVTDAQLYIKRIFVDGGRTLKRWRPAPRGMAYRIRKRTCHITIVVDNKVEVAVRHPKEIETLVNTEKESEDKKQNKE